ncbi:MAG: hypothetical protein M3O03_15660 [Pseudomonadota bacterium]|nr:hypothetical protein [Pseudomonadota bacterium]
MATALLTGCGASTWNRKLTVTVITPSGQKSGYAVQQETLGPKGGAWAPPEATGAAYSLRGEAVVVEAAPGKYLFLLIGERHPHTPTILFPGQAPLDVAARISWTSGVHVVPKDEYPLLVTFDDINDPKTVREVKPDDLAATFGPGYALKFITLEITNEKLTEGVVEKVIPWVTELRGAIDKSNYNESDTKEKNFIRTIHDGLFRQGFKK